MSASLAQPLITGAAAVFGALVGGGVLMVNGAWARKDAREGERRAVDRTAASQTLELLGELIALTFQMDDRHDVLETARASAVKEVVVTAEAKVVDMAASWKNAFFKCLVLAHQIRDDKARTATI